VNCAQFGFAKSDSELPAEKRERKRHAHTGHRKFARPARAGRRPRLPAESQSRVVSLSSFSKGNRFKKPRHSNVFDANPTPFTHFGLCSALFHFVPLIFLFLPAPLPSSAPMNNPKTPSSMTIDVAIASISAGETKQTFKDFPAL
jgi:hypothetical protein